MGAHFKKNLENIILVHFSKTNISFAFLSQCFQHIFTFILIHIIENLMNIYLCWDRVHFGAIFLTKSSRFFTLCIPRSYSTLPKVCRPKKKNRWDFMFVKIYKQPPSAYFMYWANFSCNGATVTEKLVNIFDHKCLNRFYYLFRAYFWKKLIYWIH
jgi:hypothetical protein